MRIIRANMAEVRTWPQRFTDAWRSYWKPPVNTRDPALAAYFGAAPSAAGVLVNEATALNLSAVWAAVNLIAGDVASLPLIHYKRLAGGGKERLTESKLYGVLHDAFNPEMAADVAREAMQAHVLTYGNAYAEIQRNVSGAVVALWPIEPNRVQPFRRTPSGPLEYQVMTSEGRSVTVPADVIFHVHGLGFDGIQGYSVIAKARESVAAGLAAQQFTTSFYGKGVAYSGFFEHPKALGDTAYKRLKESIATQTGAQNAGGFRILEEGMTFKPGGMPLKDAEFLATRKFDVTEVARWYNLPPHKLADLERATFSNIEHLAIDYVVGTLRRWLVRWEQEILRKLIPPLERRQQFAEHLVDGLLRGDIESRYQAYAVGRQNGWLSANDIRTYENLNPIPGGDVYLVQTNMVPLDRLNDVVDAQVRPDPAPAPAAAGDVAGGADRAHLEALVDDLKADVARRLGVSVDEVVAAVQALQSAQADARAALLRAVEAVPAQVPIPELPALPKPAPPPDPPDLSGLATAPSVDALGERLEALADVARAAADGTASVAERLDALQGQAVTPESLAGVVTDLRATLEAVLGERLATDAALRGWQEATFGLIAGKLARREIAHARKRIAAPERFNEKINVFYGRFVEDGMAELRPWLARLNGSAPIEAAIRACLTAWAERSRTDLIGQAPDAYDDLVRRWEVAHEAMLARELAEVCHARS